MTSSQNKKTAVIAGAGVAGLAAAVFLDELGYQVTLLEKKPILGGRTYSFTDKKTGLTIDNGQHLMIGAYHETIKLLESVGAKRHLQLDVPTVIPLLNRQNKKSNFKLDTTKPPFNLLKALLGFQNFSLLDKLSVLRVGSELQKIKSQKKTLPAHLTVSEWLTSLKQSQSSQKDFWEILTLATLNDHPDVTSADGLVAVLCDGYFAGPTDGHLIFPKVGLSELFVKPVEEYLKLRGQKVVSGLGIKEVRILNECVQSFVLTDDTQLKADLFISALPFRHLLQVLPAPFTEQHPQLKNLKQMQSAPIISINLFYDKPFMTDKLVGSSATRVHWFFNKSQLICPGSCVSGPVSAENNFDSGPRTQDNPDPGQFHIMGVISGAYDYLEMSKEEIVKMAQQEIEQIYPNAKKSILVHSLVNKEREATLSSRVGINHLRPQQKILDNFFVIGDWTKTGLPATIESAVKSARLMTNEII